MRMWPSFCMNIVPLWLLLCAQHDKYAEPLNLTRPLITLDGDELVVRPRGPTMASIGLRARAADLDEVAVGGAAGVPALNEVNALVLSCLVLSCLVFSCCHSLRFVGSINLRNSPFKTCGQRLGWHGSDSRVLNSLCAPSLRILFCCDHMVSCSLLSGIKSIASSKSMCAANVRSACWVWTKTNSTTSTWRMNHNPRRYVFCTFTRP
jgi:hypothetical protein